jgi:hypothetical protein
VQDKQPFNSLYVSDEVDDSGAETCVVDKGRLYAATRVSVQVFGGAGR